MVNYRCPCCSYPIMPPGVVTDRVIAAINKVQTQKKE